MKTLTNPIVVVNGMNNINKVGVVNWLDFRHLSIPYGQIICEAQGGGGKIYPVPNRFFALTVSDSGQCVTLQINPNPLSMDDQLVVGIALLTGTPYTTASQLYDATVGNGAAKLQALENQMVAWGLWPTAFAGS